MDSTSPTSFGDMVTTTLEISLTVTPGKYATSVRARDLVLR